MGGKACTRPCHLRRDRYDNAPCGRSLLEHLAILAPGCASLCSCASVRPTWGTPPSTATVAGTTPCCRRMASTSRAVARLRGYGIPCEIMELSKATTGRPRDRAHCTSGWITM